MVQHGGCFFGVPIQILQLLFLFLGLFWCSCLICKTLKPVDTNMSRTLICKTAFPLLKCLLPEDNLEPCMLYVHTLGHFYRLWPAYVRL
jgi:hypothetical protein